LSDHTKFANKLAKILNNKLGNHTMPLKATPLQEMARDTMWVPSDFLDVNRITAGSLFKFAPAGNIITIAGQEASGKSLLGLNLLKNAQAAGFFPVMVETEKALTYDTAKGAGLMNDPELGGLILRTGYVESCLISLDTVIREAVKAGVQPMILLDSLGNLDIEKTVKDVTKGKLVLDQGQFQRSIKIMLKHLTNLCAIYDIPMIIVTHIYMEPGMYGGKKIYGGQHLKFLSNTILFTSTTRRKDKTGYDLKMTSLKNRICPPFQEATIKIDIKTSQVCRFAGLAKVAVGLGLFESLPGGYINVPHLGLKLYESQIEGVRAPDVFTDDFLLQMEDAISTSGYDTITFSNEVAAELYDTSIDGTVSRKPEKKDVADKTDTDELSGNADTASMNDASTMAVSSDAFQKALEGKKDNADVETFGSSDEIEGED